MANIATTVECLLIVVCVMMMQQTFDQRVTYMLLPQLAFVVAYDLILPKPKIQRSYASNFRNFIHADGLAVASLLIPILVRLQVDACLEERYDTTLYLQVANALSCVAIASLLAIRYSAKHFLFAIIYFGISLKYHEFNLLEIHMIAVIMGFFVLFLTMIQTTASSFTQGECSMITQSVVTVIFDLYIRFKNHHFAMSIALVIEILIVSTVVILIILSPILYVIATYKPVATVDRIVLNAAFYIGGFLAVLFVLFPLFHTFIGTNPVTWMITFLAFPTKRLYCMLYMSLCSLLAMAVVFVYSTSKGRQSLPKTAIRKLFHLIAILIFVPTLVEKDFMAIISAVALVIFIVIELLRVFNIPPFGRLLHQYLDVFRDKQDQGYLLLTPIYLLLGFAAPLWLSSNYKSSNMLHSLLPYSGMISLGVGDTFAAVIGKLYGHSCWPGFKRTYVGSIACLLSQLVAWLILLILFQIPSTLQNITCIMVISILVTIAEALTLQIDNLILPVLTYTLFLTLI